MNVHDCSSRVARLVGDYIADEPERQYQDWRFSDPSCRRQVCARGVTAKPAEAEKKSLFMPGFSHIHLFYAASKIGRRTMGNANHPE
jgi:hypothetical protein